MRYAIYVIITIAFLKKCAIYICYQEFKYVSVSLLIVFHFLLVDIYSCYSLVFWVLIVQIGRASV